MQAASKDSSAIATQKTGLVESIQRTASVNSAEFLILSFLGV